MPDRKVHLPWYFRIRASEEANVLSHVVHGLEGQRVEGLQFQASAGVVHLGFILNASKTQALDLSSSLRGLTAVFSVVFAPVEEKFQSRSMDGIALSLRCERGQAMNTDPDCEFWRVAPSVTPRTDAYGKLVRGNETEVRLRWTEEELYFLFLCSYDELNLRGDEPLLDRPTSELWKTDVAEVFVGAYESSMTTYYEFEVSPRGEWLNLRVDCSQPGEFLKTALQFQIVLTARIEESRQAWCGLLCIPFRALSLGAGRAGDRLKVNFFRSQGRLPHQIAWQPTYNESFHVPAVFGDLILAE